MGLCVRRASPLFNSVVLLLPPPCFPPISPLPLLPLSFIARSYAKIILGYLNDIYDAPAGSAMKADPSLPVYIVEVGAGHGKFGYLVVEALLRLRDYLPALDPCVAPLLGVCAVSVCVLIVCAAVLFWLR